MKKYLLLFISVLGLIFNSCTLEEMISPTIEGGPIKVSFKPEVCGKATPSTKSSYSFDENEITDLNVILFDGKTTSTNTYITTYYIQSNSLNDVELIAGRTYTAAIVANFGKEITTEGDLSKIFIHENANPNAANAANTASLAAGHLVMSGIKTFTASSNVVPITVKRCVARLNLNINWGELQNSGMYVSEIKIMNSTPTMGVFSSSSKKTSETPRPSYERYSSQTPTSKSNFTFYLLENMQGTLPVLDSGKMPQDQMATEVLCTYFKITLRGTDPLNGAITYTFYPGSNTVDNFDIQRNTEYDITLTFSKNIYESSWRITPNWDYNSESASNYFTSVSLDSDVGENLYNGERFKISIVPKSNLALWLGGELTSCTVGAFYAGTNTRLTTPPVITNWKVDGNTFNIILEADFSRSEMEATGSFENSDGIMVDYKLLDPQGKIICPLITSKTVLPPYLYGSVDNKYYDKDTYLPETLYLTVGQTNNVYMFLCTSDRRNLIAVCESYGFNHEKFSHGIMPGIELRGIYPQTFYDAFIELFKFDAYRENTPNSTNGNYIWQAVQNRFSSKSTFSEYPSMVTYYSEKSINEVVLNVNANPLLSYYGESFRQKIWYKIAPISFRSSGTKLQIKNSSGVPLEITMYFTGAGKPSHAKTTYTQCKMLTGTKFSATPYIIRKKYIVKKDGSDDWVTIDSDIFNKSYTVINPAPRIDFQMKVYGAKNPAFLSKENITGTTMVLWYGDKNESHSIIPPSVSNFSTKMPRFCLNSLERFFGSTVNFTLAYNNGAFTLSSTNASSTHNYTGTFTIASLTLSGTVQSVVKYNSEAPVPENLSLSSEALIPSWESTPFTSNQASTESRYWDPSLWCDNGDPNSEDLSYDLYIYAKGTNDTKYWWYAPSTLSFQFDGSVDLEPEYWARLSGNKIATSSTSTSLTWYNKASSIPPGEATTKNSCSQNVNFAAEVESDVFSKYYQTIYMKDYGTVNVSN